MKPYHTLAFFASIFVLLALLILVFPRKGVEIGEDMKLEFATFEDVLGLNEIEYKDIDNIVEQGQDTIKAPNYQKSLFHNVFEKDTFNFRVTNTAARTVVVDVPHVEEVHQLQFPHGNKKVLYRFFWHLQNQKDVVRILHYGDSQIEGDRITSFIRTNLQKQFGGSGPGLLPAVQPYNYGITIKQSNRGSWYKYNTMEHSKTVPSGRFGVLARVARFSPFRYGATPDSTQTDSLKQPKGYTYSGSVLFRRSDKAYPTNHVFSQCRIFYGYNHAPATVSLNADGQNIGSQQLEPGAGLRVARFDVNSPERLSINFSGTDSPDIYGIALDANKGIAVDNIPMRGSAGFMFAKMNKELLGDMLKTMNVKLIIMEFGGNVTPYITSDYGYYEKMFSRQLAVIREVAPDVSIIVIGPADMSRKVGGQYVSYPNIPRIRDALRNAAFAHQAAFWDMYSAMGGKNSMPSWVFADPPLGAKDFIHFSHKGAEVISRIFYNALITEYNQYIKNSGQF